ncbi:MAG: thioredoxin-disulfide reductase [Deltaproteobacteria bacterium]
MHDVVIIGAGPAGLTAGLYAGRYKLDAVILEKFVVGGQILLSPTIENFPGFPGGIPTDQLIMAMRKQVDEVGVPVKEVEVTHIEVDRTHHHHTYTVFTKEECCKTKSIIVATGARWKKLGVPGEDRLTGRGVSYCGTCDAPLFKGKEVVVVGGGDKAMEEALYLTAYASKVTVVHRRKEFRAAQILVDKAKQDPKISFILDSTVEEVRGEMRVESVRIRDLIKHEVHDFPCQGLFIFVGISPNTEFIKKEVETDENGFIITDNSMKSSLQAVFACGDCRQKSLYQVINGCGEAAAACHSVHTYLLNK